MAATATALAVVKEHKLEIAKKDLVHVLVVDDNPEFTDPLKDQLELWGYSVDVAVDPVQGNELISRKNYQVIIADMKFPDEFISGDEFLLQNKEVVQKATTIAITANRAYITYEDELKDLDVIIIVKGGHIPTLKNITDRALYTVAEEVDKAIVRIVSGHALVTSRPPVSDEASERLKSILIGWLKEMGEPGRQSIFYKGGWYSPEDLVREVESGSEIGEDHMNMMINLFENHFASGQL